MIQLSQTELMKNKFGENYTQYNLSERKHLSWPKIFQPDDLLFYHIPFYGGKFSPLKLLINQSKGVEVGYGKGRRAEGG